VKSLYETLSFCPRCGTRYSPDSFDPLDVRFALCTVLEDISALAFPEHRGVLERYLQSVNAT